MKAMISSGCKIKAMIWDNESVLTAPDWIVSEEFWPIACQHGYGLEPSESNINAIRQAQTFLV